MDRVVRRRLILLACSAAFSIPLFAFALRASRQPACSEGGTWAPVAQLAHGAPLNLVVQGPYAYVAASGAMTILDVSNPARPVQVAHFDTPGTAFDVAVSGTHAYVADDIGGLQVIDVSDPTRPRLCASLVARNGPHPRAIALNGKQLYLTGESGLWVVDISDPARPVVKSRWQSDHYPLGVGVDDACAYIADAWGGLRVLAMSDPLRPVAVGRCETPDWAMQVEVRGRYAYVAAKASGLRVIDIADPARPVEVGACITRGHAMGVALSGHFSFVAGYDGGLSVVDVSQPDKPQEIAHCGDAGRAVGLAVSGPFLYVADHRGAIHLYDISNPAQAREVGRLSAPGQPRGLGVSGRRVFITNGCDFPLPKSFELPEDSSTLHVVRVSAARVPRELHTVSLPASAFGVTSSDRYVYLANGRKGLQVLDASCPRRLTSVGACSTPGSAVDVAISGALAAVADHYGYTSGGAKPSSLQLIDVSRPTCPLTVGHYDNDAMQSPWAVVLRGRYAYVADQIAGLVILDVSDPAQPREVARCAVPKGSTSAIDVVGTHAYVTAEDAGLYVIDVRNPKKPTVVAHSPTPDDAWDVAVSGVYAYLAAAGAGLRILDVSNPARPRHVADWNTPGVASAVAAGDGFVCLADADWGLLVFREYSPLPR
ncbi:MAG: hypothetical protein JSV65_00530 [Armatimonadota bacterium]|nr:MAG: hypothetical protein JSV65_00530 [Armatimonadota bacterium]